MRFILIRYLALFLAISATASLLSIAPGSASVQADTPGTAPGAEAAVSADAAPAAPVAPFFVDSGRIRLSTDALGTNAPGGGVVNVQKPAGGTVRQAFLIAASTGFTGYEPQNGDVTLNGQSVIWDTTRTMNNGISSVNVLADVTSQVKPGLDAAPSGLVAVSVVEQNTPLIDGIILAVVFNDPTATIDRAVVLAYGAQQVTGDRIRLARLPEVPLSDVSVNLGVGISYGFQSGPDTQDSTINVNGVRLTSSAGGQDDGQSENGSLITVGGLGDSPNNPADPFARGNQASCPRCDDELYDLTSFATDDDATELELTTTNPSMDDNFMFAALDVLGATVTWTPNVDPCGELDIAVCYAPELRFHPLEEFFPMNASTWILGTELRWAADNACRDRSLGTAITAERLTNDTYRHYEISNGLCRERKDDTWYQTTQWTRPFGKDVAPNGEPRATQMDGDPLANNEGFFLKWVDGAKPTGAAEVDGEIDAPIYVEQTADKLTYWFFYGYDPKSVLPADDILAHDGDWERIEINLENNVAVSAEYFGHGCTTGELTWPWPDATDDTHPAVYVAQGTHASYTFSGRLPGSSLCEPLKGVTDWTSFTEESTIWQSWTGVGVVPVQSQCWYGFGGAWGDTGSTPGLRGDQTGPAGPPFNGSTNPRLPATAECNNAIGQVEDAPDSEYSWLEEVALAFVGGAAGTSYTVALESVPLKVAEGSVQSDGRTEIRFSIPAGTAQGLHDIAIRSTETGEDLFVLPIQVEIPDECVATSSMNDIDGDEVLDQCDPNPLDGPLGDFDNDGILNTDDNCDTVPNPDQASFEDRSEGSACDRRDGFNPVPTYQVIDTGDPLCGIYSPTIVGTEGDDRIVGTPGDDIIQALGGNDVIISGDGNDVICAGSGDDTVFAGAGDDKIYGDAGADTIHGQTGADLIEGGDGSDDLRGNTGSDIISGGADPDVLFGDGGNDSLDGGDGDDRIYGGSQPDELLGGTGADLLSGGPGNDSLKGEAGNDELRGGAGADQHSGGMDIDLCIGGGAGIMDTQDGSCETFRFISGLP